MDGLYVYYCNITYHFRARYLEIERLYFISWGPATIFNNDTTNYVIFILIISLKSN